MRGFHGMRAMILAAAVMAGLPAGFGQQTSAELRTGPTLFNDGWASKNREHRGNGKAKRSDVKTGANGKRAVVRRKRQMAEAVCIDPVAIANYRAVHGLEA